MTFDIYITGIVLITLSGTLCWGVVYGVFKQSFIFPIGSVILAVITMVACFAFTVGQKGLIHLIWATPTSIIGIISSYYILTKRVQQPIAHLTQLIVEMSNKNLTASINQNYKSKSSHEILELFSATEILLKNYKSLIDGLKESTEQVYDSSKQISTNAQEISNSSSDQASVIEEISSAMEEITGSVHLNSDKAIQTKEISQSSFQHLNNSQEKIIQAAELIHKIETHVNLVTEIAAQTDMLAINAAIEAARSGAAGKGFSVVANEVRKLATKSNATANLITSIGQNGVNTINTVKTEMNDLVVKNKNSVELIQEVALANREMTASTEQVNVSIQQFNNSIQGNASASEELSATSVQLVDLVQKLNEEVNSYQI